MDMIFSVINFEVMNIIMEVFIEIQKNKDELLVEKLWKIINEKMIYKH